MQVSTYTEVEEIFAGVGLRCDRLHAVYISTILQDLQFWVSTVQYSRLIWRARPLTACGS